MRSLRLIMEGSRDNMLLKYLDAVKNVYPDMTLSLLKKILLEKLVSYGHIMALSLGSNFYLAGAARYYFNGDLTTNKEVNLLNPDVEDNFIEEVCENLSKIIKFLRDKYLDSDATVWEQPEDLGELSIDKLFKKYSRVITAKAPKPEKKPETEEERIVGLSNGYTYEIIYSFDDVKKYAAPNAPFSWCISTGESNLKYYMRQNNSFFVIFTIEGWREVRRERGKNYPLDAYGVSAMAMQLSKSDGHIVGGTTRWNHGQGMSIYDADNRINQSLLSNLTGITQEGLKSIRDTYTKFLPMHVKVSKSEEGIKISAKDFAEAKRQFSYIKLCIKNSQSPFLPMPRNENGMFSSYKVLLSDKPEYGVVNDEFKKRNWRKCVVSVTINVNNIPFTTILDHGVIMNNEILSNEDNAAFLQRTDFYNETDRHHENKDFIILPVKTKKIVYDVRNKKALEINGEKLFSNVIETRYRCILIMVGNNDYAIYDKENGTFFNYNGRNEFENILLAKSSRWNDINLTRNTTSADTKIINVVVEYATGEMFALNIENFKTMVFDKNKTTKWLATYTFGETDTSSEFVLLRKSGNGIPMGSLNNDWHYSNGYGDMSSQNLKWGGVEIPHFKMVYGDTFKKTKEFKDMDIRYAGPLYYGMDGYISVIDYDIRENPLGNTTNSRYARIFNKKTKKFLVSPIGDVYFYPNSSFYDYKNNKHFVFLKSPNGNGYIFNVTDDNFVVNEFFNNRIKNIDRMYSGKDEDCYIVIRYGTRNQYSGKIILYNVSKGEPVKYNGEVKPFKSGGYYWNYRNYNYVFTDFGGTQYGFDRHSGRLTRIN